MIFETHSHLFDKAFDEDRIECLMRCKELDMSIMFVGYDHVANQKAFDLASRSKNYYSSAGIHPSEASENYQDDVIKLEEFINTHKVQALGECGLDYYWDSNPSRDLQKALFRAQLDLAVKLDLPVIIHTREAWADTLEILKEYKGKVKGVMHCYTGSFEMAKEFIKLGFYIAIGGAVTFKNANEAKRVVANIDLNYLVVETDCPYITPTPFRGKRNESAYIIYPIAEIAKIRNMTVEEVENITYINACKLFNINQ